MKVLAINGSARKSGNTLLLIQTAFEELSREGIETEVISLAGQVIEPCRACWGCGSQENCIHGKDAFQEIFRKMTEADGLLLASPVYSANISSNMQAVLERAAVVCDMHPELMKHKVGRLWQPHAGVERCRPLTPCIIFSSTMRCLSPVPPTGICPTVRCRAMC